MNRSDIIKKEHFKRIYNPQMKLSSTEAKKKNYLIFNFNCVSWIVFLVWEDVTQLRIFSPFRKYNSSYHKEHFLINKK